MRYIPNTRKDMTNANKAIIRMGTTNHLLMKRKTLSIKPYTPSVVGDMMTLVPDIRVPEQTKDK